MNSEIKAMPAGFFRDLWTVAARALRAIPKEPESIIPALIIPLFFFVVNVGALSDISKFAGVNDFIAFQLPVAIVFAVTGISRASALVTDIKYGYFDRLLVSPVKRTALLLGLMIADLALVIALSIPVIILGAILGVEFVTGLPGILAFLALAGPSFKKITCTHQVLLTYNLHTNFVCKLYISLPEARPLLI